MMPNTKISQAQKPVFEPQILSVAIMRLAHGEGLALPSLQSPHAAGYDLAAAVAQETPVVLAPMARALIPTGIALALPQGCEGQIRSRSGLASKHGVVVLNSPGTIDADYRGEVFVLLANFGSEDFVLTRGQRIAQLVIAPVLSVAFYAVSALDETERGKAGFGSTGS